MAFCDVVELSTLASLGGRRPPSRFALRRARADSRQQAASAWVRSDDVLRGAVEHLPQTTSCLWHLLSRATHRTVSMVSDSTVGLVQRGVNLRLHTQISPRLRSTYA